MSFIPEIESGAAPRVGRSKVAAVSSGWAQFALAVGGFGIGTGEFAIMGLLPQWLEISAFRCRRRDM